MIYNENYLIHLIDKKQESDVIDFKEEFYFDSDKEFKGKNFIIS